MKVSAASVFCEPAGIASDHAHNQLAPSFGQFSMPQGGGAKPTWSATWLCLGSVTKEAATVASIHMPHLPWPKSDSVSLKPFDATPGGPELVSMST